MKKPSVGDEELQGKGKTTDFDRIKLPEDDEEILDRETFQVEGRAILHMTLNEQENSSRNCEAFCQEPK